MAYNKTVWQNGVTPINETNLNKLENQLETLSQTGYFNGQTTSINDLNTDGKWRGYIPPDSDDANYLGYYGNVIVETFVQSSTAHCIQRITRTYDCKTSIRSSSTNNFSYNDTLLTGLEPDVLLNTNATSTGTLSANISNYKKIKVFFSDTDNFKKSIEIYNNNSSTLAFDLSSLHNNGTLFIKSARCNINGTSLTIDRQYQSAFYTNPRITITSGTFITIHRIEGYRY